MPKVSKPVTIKARVKDRFFLNYCTFGYTMPWWKWDEWEHFIDWMALNGINLPLAITGQESIWYKVWTEMGLSDKEVRAYFTGPSHLPWHRMLNIDYWGGPLPMSWLDGQLALQQKITARERQFNMRPVLPAFAGHVPRELSRIFPKAKITRLEAWSGYPDEYACSFLDPMDSLFTVVQKKFIETETKLYGTDHVYGIDLFNELMPPSWEPEYLGRVSRQVYEALEKADKDAVWLQMTWLFWNERKYWTNDRVKPYITSFPADRQLLLDYYCERQEVWQRTDKYFGVPYIWCYLGNFGGNTMLVGDVKNVNKLLENTFKNGGRNFTGIGSTLSKLAYCNILRASTAIRLCTRMFLRRLGISRPIVTYLHGHEPLPTNVQARSTRMHVRHGGYSLTAYTWHLLFLVSVRSSTYVLPSASIVPIMPIRA